MSIKTKKNQNIHVQLGKIRLTLMLIHIKKRNICQKSNVNFIIFSFPTLEFERDLRRLFVLRHSLM